MSAEKDVLAAVAMLMVADPPSAANVTPGMRQMWLDTRELMHAKYKDRISAHAKDAEALIRGFANAGDQVSREILQLKPETRKLI